MAPEVARHRIVPVPVRLFYDQRTTSEPNANPGTGRDAGPAPDESDHLMTQPLASPIRLVVTGDPTVDWMVVSPTGTHPAMLHASYQWEAGNAAQIGVQAGGAALLRATVEAACAVALPDGAVAVAGVVVPPDALADPRNGDVTRGYQVWQQFPARSGARDLVWRLHEFLGRQPAVATGSWPPVAGTADCVVLDDANLGFRDARDAWSFLDAAGGSPPAHVLLKLANPFGAGPLWHLLAARYADRLTVYCAVGDLRKEHAPVGQPLAWERTAQEVERAVRDRPDLAAAARVVVSLGMSGAVVVQRDGPATLVYDALNQEGDWERTRPGAPLGLGTCLVAALAVGCARDGIAPDWLAAVRGGLGAARVLHEQGHVAGTDDRGGLRFPTAAVARAIADGAPDDAFQTAAVPADDGWRLFAIAAADDELRVATRIALEGDEEAVRGLPVERMGAWASVDRTEIESVRSVRNIVAEYLAQARKTRPLNLAVFGPPGAGKSFAIKQMAKEWAAGGTPIATLEFNLSQFAGEADLAAALQRVRDAAVEQTLPLVFWDEFDSTTEGRELGWLVRFLAPMQDGSFVEGGVTRPIGPAIFVFAGGTHATMASFKARAVEFRGAKATDFVSRLRGFVDVLGPNPAGPDDRTYVLRRALLLRALLRGRAPRMFASPGGRLHIDPGVLRALLGVPAYLHGSRSMESVIDMSALAGSLRYERSALPAPHQLDLHVDAAAFLELVRREPDR